MAKKNKLWFSGEDAQLAARFTKCLTKALYNRRASYLRAKAEQAASEISIEECSEEVDKMYMPTTKPVEEIVESKLMWESIRKYLHKLTPRECEVMISLYYLAKLSSAAHPLSRFAPLLRQFAFGKRCPDEDDSGVAGTQRFLYHREYLFAFGLRFQGFFGRSDADRAWNGFKSGK